MGSIRTAVYEVKCRRIPIVTCRNESLIGQTDAKDLKILNFKPALSLLSVASRENDFHEPIIHAIWLTIHDPNCFHVTNIDLKLRAHTHNFHSGRHRTMSSRGAAEF
jgi:hypothetical protein